MAEGGDNTDSRRPKGKIFKDPIHGTMEIPEICVKIIDTPQFQRLRNIKQLGGNYYVYPGACHNRFEHSIGVCHLAGKQFIQLVTKQPDLYGDDERTLKDKHLKCVQIAGLCHDLGHGPYSHVFQDLFLPAVGRVGVNSWKHEDGSQMMFQHLLTENNISLELQEKDLILHMILPQTNTVEEEAHFVEIANGKTFLYQIVSNKETGIDVDKFDYLARDCHHLGLGNSFDSERLMKLARVIGGKISYPQKTRDNIRSLFQTRLDLHEKAYKHKTAKCIEQMLTDAMVKVKDVIKFPDINGQVTLKNCVDDPEAYTQLDDSIITMIKRYEPDQGAGEQQRRQCQEAKELLKRVDTRKLYECVLEAWARNDRDNTEFDQERVRNDILQNSPQYREKCVIHVERFNTGQRGRKNLMTKVPFYRKGMTSDTTPLYLERAKLKANEELLAEYVILRVYSRSDSEEETNGIKDLAKEWVDESEDFHTNW